VAIIDLTTLEVEMVAVLHRPAEEVFSRQAIEQNEASKGVRDYVKSLADLTAFQTESVRGMVDQYAEDPAVKARVVEHCTAEGLL
jgi:hypothetical protein